MILSRSGSGYFGIIQVANVKHGPYQTRASPSIFSLPKKTFSLCFKKFHKEIFSKQMLKPRGPSPQSWLCRNSLISWRTCNRCEANDIEKKIKVRCKTFFSSIFISDYQRMPPHYSLIGCRHSSRTSILLLGWLRTLPGSHPSSTRSPRLSV